MNNGIEQYLAELRKELAGSDRATIQDALSDAEEYLRTALNSARDAESGLSESEAMAAIIDKYGAPGEIAAAYKEIESRTPPAFTRAVPEHTESPAIPAPAEPVTVDTRPLYARFFGIYAEPRMWGSLLYLLFAMGTGIIYFTWAVTGLSISLGFLVLIIGVPFLVLFLLSVRGIALVEGRLVEALLGIRMPRRPLFTRKDIGWWQKVKNLFAERQTWTALVYMVLQMFLGILYFCVIVTLIALVVWLIGRPIWEMSFGLPAFITESYEYYSPAWLMPFQIIGGVLLLTLTMHLVKITGKMHGLLAKAMLVKE